MDLMTGLINLAAAALAFGVVAIGFFKKNVDRYILYRSSLSGY
jgi:hypothetical protein